MKKFLFMFFTMLTTLNSAQAMSVNEFMDKNIAPISDAVARLIFFPIKI